MVRGGGVEGGGSPALFQKLDKSPLIFRKKIPDSGHLWVTFLILKCNFKEFPRDKTGQFFHAWPFFLVLQMIVYRSALITRKLPCPKKLLVTRLKSKLFL